MLCFPRFAMHLVSEGKMSDLCPYNSMNISSFLSFVFFLATLILVLWIYRFAETFYKKAYDYVLATQIDVWIMDPEIKACPY